jgi:serine/threonine protein kinase
VIKRCSKVNKYINGLKSMEGILSLDYYLTDLDNSLTKIKASTMLTVHYATQKDISLEEKVGRNSFQYLKVIGCGGYSNVVMARKKDSGRMYAIKIIKKDATYMKTNKSVYLSEVNIMKKLTGIPFIVKLHYTFQTKNELYFAMDPCIGGTLFYFLTHCAKGYLNSSIIKFYVCEIIIALEKIHSKNIMYRDLKPENVLIDIDGHIKLSDFGLSKQIRRRDDTSLTFCGSPEYLPPEMLLGQEHSRSVDFYTLG